MQKITFKGEHYNGGAVIQKNERTVYCKMTVDVHEAHTIKGSATEFVYTDAMLSGAGKYDREAFIDAVSMLGASIGIAIGNGRLTFTLKSLDTNLPKLLKLFETMVTSPAFTKSELTRIITQATNERIEHKENAKAIAPERFTNELYGKTDRRHTSTPEEIITELAAVTAADLQKLHAKVRGGFWTVTVGGSKESVALLTKSVDHCKKGVEAITFTGEHTQHEAKAKTVLHNVPSKQNIEFALGAPLALTLHHPDYLPFVFGLSVLGKWGGFTGRLMSTVREKEGLTYGIYAKTETVEGTEQGHWRVMTFFAPDKALQGLTSTLREIKKIHKGGITQSEYDRFRVILTTQQTMLADSLVGSVATLHGYFCADFNLKEIDEFTNRLLGVTRKEINQALKAHLNPDALVISGAGPVQSVKKDIETIP